MSPKRKKIASNLQKSPAGMLLLLAGGFALFSVLFRYEVPRVSAAEHKTGQISLYPVNEDSDRHSWLQIHDPARIARGGQMPEPEPRPEPGDAPKPQPVVPLQMPEAVAPAAVNPAEIPADLPPLVRPEKAELALKSLAPEVYPKILVNKAKYGRKLPETLLKQAAAVNAGTVELRFSAGVVPGEIRALVMHSSGSIALDQALIKYFQKQSFRELPAILRIIWDATGEVTK